MADMKSLDQWRNNFRATGADIFEIIKRAIMVAASDRPMEFRIKRDKIAQTLFSCELVKCSGCEKCRNDQRFDVEPNGTEQRDKEVLSDESEEETEVVGEVLRIKEILDNSGDESESVVYHSLTRLQQMDLSVKILEATEVGRSVNALRKHASKDVAWIARMLIKVWRETVDEWIITTEKLSVSNATPESLNPSVQHEEEDGELSKNHREPPMEKQDVHKCKQQRPMMVPKVKDSNSDAEEKGTYITMKKQSAFVRKPVSGQGRPMNLNMETKFQISNIPKIQVTPEQTKPMDSDEATIQARLEATKRKLHEGYQQAENMKQHRRIQVLELHELMKEGLVPKSRHIKPGNMQKRQRANGPW